MSKATREIDEIVLTDFIRQALAAQHQKTWAMAIEAAAKYVETHFEMSIGNPETITGATPTTFMARQAAAIQTLPCPPLADVVKGGGVRVRTNECQHGNLRRSCVVCGLEDELALTTRKLKIAKAYINKLARDDIDQWAKFQCSNDWMELPPFVVEARQALKTINAMKE